MSGDFYRIDTTGTNSSADWDWKFLETNLAMACGVAVDDKRIYISGGFHMHSKSSLIIILMQAGSEKKRNNVVSCFIF
jgi:hypothetical protein